MTNKINEIRQELDSLLLANNEEKDRSRELVETARKAQDAATIETAEAYKAADVKRYHAAQDACRAAADAIKMHSARLAEAERAQLITAGEYADRVHIIEAEQEAAYNKAYSQIAGLIDKAAEINKQLQKDIEAGDDCLKVLQVDCFKDPEYMNAPEAVKYYKLKHWTRQEVPQFVDFMLESEFYKDYKKAKGTK